MTRVRTILTVWIVLAVTTAAVAVTFDGAGDRGDDVATVAPSGGGGRAGSGVPLIRVPDVAGDPPSTDDTPTTPRPRADPAPATGTPATGPTTTPTSSAAPEAATPSPAAPPPTTRSPTTQAPAPRGVARTSGAILLAWTSGGLPAGFAADVAAIEQVTAHTTVWGDLVVMTGSRSADGTVVDQAPAGWGWPLDALAVEPASYASFQAGVDRDTIAALRPGQGLLTESSARLRRIGPGAVVSLAGGEVAVAGVVADHNGGGAELLVHVDDAGRVGIDDQRFLLVTDTDRAAVEQAIRDRTPSGTFLSLRGEDDTRYLRHADRVDPQAHVKLVFGEFLFQDASGREIRMDPAWVDAHIVTETVPILGRIRCHRLIVPRVRAAMQELVDAGRSDTVDPAHYAGCQYGRRIAPGAGLSRHSWGLALDLNIEDNPRGTYESQDPALVAAMRRQGFNWGGDWEYPDPGHYEAISRP